MITWIIKLSYPCATAWRRRTFKPQLTCSDHVPEVRSWCQRRIYNPWCLFSLNYDSKPWPWTVITWSLSGKIGALHICSHRGLMSPKGHSNKPWSFSNKGNYTQCSFQEELIIWIWSHPTDIKEGINKWVQWVSLSKLCKCTLHKKLFLHVV